MPMTLTPEDAVTTLDYKYNTRKETDGARTFGAIQRIGGKRLMLRHPKAK